MFLITHGTLNGLYYADVPLSKYSLTHSSQQNKNNANGRATRRVFGQQTVLQNGMDQKNTQNVIHLV